MKKLFDKSVFLCYSISVENKKGVKNDRTRNDNKQSTDKHIWRMSKL